MAELTIEEKLKNFPSVNYTSLYETVEQLEKLLPYHINPKLLDNMRSLPDLCFPVKDAVY